MFLITAALLVSAQAVSDQPATAPAPAPKKERKICKLDDTSGSRMAKRICLTAQEWAEHPNGVIESSRAGLSGRPQDH
jgi:hypothetical protein